LTAFILNLLRTSLLFCAALTASTIAPARADPAAEPLLAMTSTELPKVAVPVLLDNQAEPVLTSSDALPPADAPAPVEQAQPALKPSGDLGAMVTQLRASAAGSRELECLATGIYFESKSEPLAGQLAVGEVIANRAKSGRFASTYCGVLMQRGQFSFVRGKSLPFVPKTSKQWHTAVAVAKIVAQGLKTSTAPKALFFHARHVSPRWKLKRVASIGNHIFYR
jgi:spore germination cell wall hydrolase CwlJ-like protein